MKRIRLVQWIRILAQYLGASVRARLLDRGDLTIAALSILLHHALGLAFLSIVFLHIPDVAGWRYTDVLVVYGAFQIVTALFYFFFSWTLWFSSLYLIERRLDTLLVRPAPTLLLVVAEGAGQSLAELPGADLGITLVILALRAGGHSLTGAQGLAFALLLLCGVAILGGLFTLLALSAFWVRSRRSPAEPLMSTLEFAQYPQTIYAPWLRALFTFVFPLAFVASQPSTWALGLATSAGPWYGLLWAALFWLAVVVVWRQGVRRYESAGS